MGFEDELKRVVDAALHELTALANVERDRARQQGVDEGRAKGLDDGHSKGFEAGHSEGFEAGRSKGFDDGRARGFDEGRTQGASEGRAEGWEDGREHGRAEGREEAEREAQAVGSAALASAGAETTAELDASARLVDGVRAFDQARTLGEILDTLAQRAQREAARVAVFIVRGDRLRSWRLAGFDSVTGDGVKQDVADIADLPLGDADVIAEAVRTGAPASGETGQRPAGAPAFARLSPGQESFAAPIGLLGEVVAVLYADTEPTASGASATRSRVWPERLEVLARHAARCLEAMTAVKAARALTGATDATDSADAAPPSALGGSTPHPGDAEDADSSARRYAKLLVSEIKLYHEDAVVAGRRDGDLATRLGGEISRARALYEQRVPSTVRDRGDYFRDELVRTLAHGDAALLG